MIFENTNIILKFWLFIFAFLFFSFLAILPFPWNETVKNAASDLQFKIRGERRLSDKIVVVFIGPEDVQTLGWPLTRDYYGYITHILKEANAKAIGFGILFDTKDNRYPEFDVSLADFFHSAQNVCLPMTFSELQKTNDKFLVGKSPTVPIAELRSQVASIGFSTLPEETIIRKVPLIVQDNDSLQFSFGFELARLYLDGFVNSMQVSENKIQFLSPQGKIIFPMDQNGFIRLNHIGDLEHINSISFIDLIRRFRTEQDSIDFSNKPVLVAVTSPGIAPQKVTPLSSAFPATFIHATVAENLIEGNYLKDTSKFGEVFIIFLLLFFLQIIWRYTKKSMFVYNVIGLIFLYWIVTQVSFRFLNFVLPLFYPIISYGFVLGFLLIFKSKKKSQTNLVQKTLLEQEIRKKQGHLEQAEKILRDTENRFKTELREKEAVTTEVKRLLEENRNQVIRLEQQIRDLETCQNRDFQKSTIFPEIIHHQNSKLKDVLDLVTKIGSDDISVLISGETGTGKEVIARAIHQSGKRKLKPFVAVNCGALPETLLEMNYSAMRRAVLQERLRNEEVALNWITAAQFF